MATRWGIISAGKICHDFVSAVRSLPESEHQIVAVAARKLDNAKEFASRHHIPKAYGSYEELAKDPDVEIVYVGAIHTQHISVGRMLLNAGKNVLMEKPMCLSKKDTQELIDLAKKNNVFLMEAMWARFFPVYEQLEKELQKKTIGDIVHIYCTFGIEAKDAVRLQEKDLGGGAIYDIGIYMVNAMMVVYKEKPKKIAAVGHLNHSGADTSVSASLQFSNGALGTFVLNSLHSLPCELVITGTKGQMRVPKPCWCPTELITPEKTYSYPLPDTALPCNYPNSSGLRYEAAAVRECLKKGLKECPKMSLKDSLIFAEILEELCQQVGVKYS